ncbi:MAG: LytR/AlgR family response regulator transcription factor [Ruminococcus sp.]|jgi:two-component system response regulator LytT
MIRIGICDDESRARDALRFQIERLTEEGSEKIVYEFSTGKGAVRWLRNHPGEIDLLFLDVEMPEISGIEAAREIRKFDRNLLIVFVTGYPDFVFEGYRVQAMDYLVKPTEDGKLMEVIERVREKFKRERKDQIVVQNTEGLYRLYRSDILYCYSEKRKVYLVLKDKEISFYGKLGELSEKLGQKFVRVHQRYLVNGRYVEYIGSNFIGIDGIRIPVSRSMKTEATTALARIMLEDE